MKSPAQLAARWRKQWQAADYREQRLLDRDAWPVSLAIGKPTSQEFTAHTHEVREHVRRWRDVTIGRVDWESVSYRAGREPVQVPVSWTLANPAEWAAAASDQLVQLEFQRLATALSHSDPVFHRALVRQPRFIMNASEDEGLKAAQLAIQLTSGCAQGRPLRTLSLASIDSKFFERHRLLILQLLDARFDGQASEQGLESFLGALDEGDHWLLIAPLAPDLLHFKRQSIPVKELISAGLPGARLLIVENEQCLHQLPSLPDTVAVLGSGLNLAWLQAPWLTSKTIAYWGDLDTWGLTMLARARQLRPELTPLLMTRDVFDRFAGPSAVAEPQPAPEITPPGLTDAERDLYQHLRQRPKGRLEQEFLPASLVTTALAEWALGSYFASGAHTCGGRSF